MVALCYQKTVNTFYLYLPQRFVAADVADFQAKRFLFATDTTVPKLFSFIAVDDNKAVFVDLDLAIGMPLAIGCGAVNTQELDELQAVLADFNRFIRLLCRRVEKCLLIELVNFRKNSVADEFVNRYSISTEKILVVFFGVELCIITDNNIIKNSLEITEFDFNVGTVTNAGLEALISEKRQSGVYFSVYGFGRGNLQAEKMETLALKGNGNYSYIDSVKEAKRALVTDIGGSLVTVAKDVKAGITFNPDYVESFRLIGYENKLLTEEEFNDSNTDAGELGSGHTVTVVYEIKMKNEGVFKAEALLSIADVIIKYKPTENSGGNGTEEKELRLGVLNSAYTTSPTEENLFVAGVVEFALILRDSEYKAEANLEELISTLESLDLSDDEFKTEFRDLVSYYATKE